MGRALLWVIVVVVVAAGGGAAWLMTADADDWPKELYRRLGFRDRGTTAVFSRS